MPNRKHDSFKDILPDPLATLDEQELNQWLSRHKKNLLLDAPLGNDEDDDHLTCQRADIMMLTI